MAQPDKLRILFADDEEPVLLGLRASLRRERKRWDMRFAQGASRALEMLQEEPADVVVSDMRMPAMDGAALLAAVHKRSPRALRIVLSGQSDEEAAMRAVPSAHQWLAKPIERDALVDTIERARGMLDLLGNDDLFEIAGGVNSLPAAPRLYRELITVLSNPEAGAEEVARIIEQDPATSSRMLQMCNSAFFSLPRTITSVRDAVTILGFRTIGQLVLCAEVIHQMPVGRVPGFSVDEFQGHGLLVSRMTQAILGDESCSQSAACAGLLHDLGQLILAAQAPERFARAIRVAGESERCLHDVEQEVFGATHAEVGAAVLALWGLPVDVVEAVANHHAPDVEEFGLVAAVYVAQCLVEEAQAEASGKAPLVSISAKIIGAFGLEPRLPEWRARMAIEMQTIDKGVA